MSLADAPNRTVTVVADLHISAGGGDDFAEDRALVGLLDRIAQVAESARPDSTLLILGDLVDFSKVRLAGRRSLDSSAGSALAKLDVAASAHREVFAALGRVAAAGVNLELVAGNHDAVLVRPAVRDRLAELLAGAAGAAQSAVSVRVHSWFVHLPGVLYAEHGHQHHDVNRMPELFDPSKVERGGPLRAPLGLHVAHYLNERDERGGGPLREALAAGRSLPPAAVAAARMFGPEPLPAAGDRALPATALAEIAAQSAPTVRRLAGRVVRREDRDRYMRTAAARIDRILSGCGAATPFYAFGHTHIAADAPLAAGRAARYLNPGSWSVLRESGSPPRYLQLDLDPDRPRAALLTWDEPPPRRRAPQAVGATRR